MSFTHHPPGPIKIRVYKSPVNGQWHFQFRTDTGEVIARAERGYSTEHSAKMAAHRIASATFVWDHS